MSENFTQTPNRLFDLVSDSYSTLLNTWLWSTQRALEFNKVIVAQIEANQVEGRKYVEELNSKARQGLQIMQEVWQEGAKTYNTNLNTWRTASESSVADLNKKFEQLQQRFEAPAN